MSELGLVHQRQTGSGSSPAPVPAPLDRGAGVRRGASDGAALGCRSCPQMPSSSP